MSGDIMGGLVTEGQGFFDDIAFQLPILDHEVQGTMPLHMPVRRSHNVIERAFRIIRDPLTHQRYVQHLRGKLNSDPPSPEERKSSNLCLLLTTSVVTLKDVLRKIPEIHIIPDKSQFHGYHLRQDTKDQNKVFLNSNLLSAVERYLDDGTEKSWSLIFLLLATLAHEYGHWLRTLVFGIENTPSQLGYSHARAGAKEGEGESGFVAEIALFNCFVRAERDPNGQYYGFRIVDQWNIAHRIPTKLVQRYWENEHFEPFQLHDPIYPKDPAYEAASKNQHDAKGTQAESLLQQNVPLCPCVPFVVLSEMKVDVLLSKHPRKPNAGAFGKDSVEISEEETRLKRTQV